MSAPVPTLDTPTPGRLGNRAWGVLSGTCNVSSYDTNHPEVTVITGKFLRGVRVVCDGVSSGLYIVKWDSTTKSFIAYKASGTSGALVEASGSDNVGTFDFIATGQLG